MTKRPRKTPNFARTMNEFKAGFLETSMFARQFWTAGRMLFRDEGTSHRYLITRQPSKPTPVARLIPGTARSTRLLLYMPNDFTGITREDFRAACTDEQLALIRFSNSQSKPIIASFSTEDDELKEARAAGRVLGNLHKQGKLYAD